MDVEATARQQVLRAEGGQQVVAWYNETVYVLTHTHIHANIFCKFVCTHTRIHVNMYIYTHVSYT